MNLIWVELWLLLLLLLSSSSPSPSSPQISFGADYYRTRCRRIAVLALSNNVSPFPRSHPSARSRRVWAVWCRCIPATQVLRGPERKCSVTPRTSWTSTSPPSDGQYMVTYSVNASWCGHPLGDISSYSGAMSL
jgi:hypothetical protein